MPYCLVKGVSSIVDVLDAGVYVDVETGRFKYCMY